MLRLSFHRGWRSSFRSAVRSRLDGEGASVLSFFGITFSVSFVFAAAFGFGFSHAAWWLWFLAPSLLFMALYAPPRPLWGERIRRAARALKEDHAVKVPDDIAGMLNELYGVPEPELLVRRRLSRGDSLSMMGLARALEGIRPGLHQQVSIQVSGETSEALARVTEALKASPPALVVRV